MKQLTFKFQPLPKLCKVDRWRIGVEMDIYSEIALLVGVTYSWTVVVNSTSGESQVLQVTAPENLHEAITDILHNLHNAKPYTP